MSQLAILKQRLVDAGGLLKTAEARLTELEQTEAAYKRHLSAEKIAQEMVDRTMIPIEKYAQTVSDISTSDQDLDQLGSNLSFISSTGVEHEIGQAGEPSDFLATEKEAEESGPTPTHVVKDREATASRLMSSF